VVEIARAAELGGASWLTIHARTKAQMYAPPVDYRSVGRARAALSIPVVANGDICSWAALSACAEQSGARAFMLGRAALAYPFLFRELRGDHSHAGVPYRQVLARYLALMAEGGFEPGARLRRLKQWLGLARVFSPEAARWFELIKRVEEPAQADDLLASAPPAAA
jgi:tRNA-dihydrouridine synthase C